MTAPARKIPLHGLVRLAAAVAATLTLAVLLVASRHAGRVDEVLALVERVASLQVSAGGGIGPPHEPGALDERTLRGALAASSGVGTSPNVARAGLAGTTALALVAGLGLAGHLVVSRVLARARA